MLLNLLQDPDTLSSTLSVDTTSTSTGINPILLINERRQERIEEYRQTQQQQQQIVRRAIPPKRIDTTCYICPISQPLSTFRILEPQNQNLFPASYQFLLGKEELLALSKKPQTVFIYESDYKSTQISIKPKEISEHIPNHTFQWVLIPLMLAFFIIAFIKLIYRRYLQDFINGLVFSFPIKRMIRDSNVPLQRLQIFLDALYFIIVPLFVLVVIYNQAHFIKFNYPSYIIVLLIFGIMLSYRALRYIFLTATANLTGNYSQIKEIYFNQLVFPRVLSIFLVPLLFIYLYASHPINLVALYVTIALSLVIIILRQIRTFIVFISKGFSIFYFILYLCALEIVPILILFREVIWS